MTLFIEDSLWEFIKNSGAMQSLVALSFAGALGGIVFTLYGRCRQQNSAKSAPMLDIEHAEEMKYQPKEKSKDMEYTEMVLDLKVCLCFLQCLGRLGRRG